MVEYYWQPVPEPVVKSKWDQSLLLETWVCV